MSDVPWEDYERLRMTLQSIIRAAQRADDSVLRGYVLGITISLRRQLAAEDCPNRAVATPVGQGGTHSPRSEPITSRDAA